MDFKIRLVVKNAAGGCTAGGGGSDVAAAKGGASQKMRLRIWLRLAKVVAAAMLVVRKGFIIRLVVKTA